MANESYIYQITTSDGKVHEVNKAYIDKYGMDAYAREYKGATVRMRDKEGADYAIPLVHYDKAVAQGLHIFTIDATPSAAAPKTPAQAQTAAQSSQTVQAGKAQQAGKAAQAQTAEDTPQVTPPDKVPSGDKPAWLLNAMAAKEVAKAYDLAASIGEQRERNKRVMGSMTQKGRDRVKAGRTLAGMAGTPTRVLGLASPGGSDESSSLGSDHDTATKKTMLVGSPKPYGVKLVDGKVKTVWQLTDGSLTTDLGEADKAENVARKARMAHEHEKAVRNIVPDVVDGLWEEALSKDRLDDEAYIEKREKDSKSIGGFLSAFAEASMDPVRKHSSISEIEREKTRRETFDLDRLTESAYKRIPDDLRREVIGGYEEYFRKNPGELKGRNVSKAAEDALRGDIYREFYERVVASQMPKSTEEFVMRKALDQPLLTGEAKLAGATLARSHGLDIAETEAMERYGSGHKVASGVGTVLNIAFDPTMMATGAFGGAVSKGVMNTAGKAMAKGMAGKVLSRPLAGRMLEHVTAGGVGFMGFEMAKDVQGQLRHGGVVNPETGKSEGYSMESVLNSGVRGLAMGAATGAVAPLVGNVADGLVKGTTSTAGKLALRGGQAAVSKFFEGTIFAAPEIYEFRTMGNDDFDRLYAKRFGYDQETDATKRDEARKKARNSLSWDCFVENEAMMVGFGATGAVKSAPRVIAGLRRHDPAKLGRPLTREERIDNNRSFMERLGRQLDGMPGGMFLTKEEQQELRDKGYGKLSELFRYDPVNGGRRNRTPGRTPAGESSTSGKSSSLGSDHDVKGIHGIFREEQRTDERSRDFDGYDAMERVMGDDNVSEAVRAKLYYLLTGRAVMPSSVMGYDTVDNHDGTVTINARNSRGGIVVSRRVRYKDRGKSDDLQVAEHWSAVPEVRREINKVERQIELNTIDILEQYATRAVGLVVMDDVKGAVGRRHNLPEQAVENIYMKHFNGEALSEAEMAIVEDVNSFMEEGYGKYGSLTPEGLRQRVKEDTGVDVDAALRKGKYERSMKEDVALHEYGSLLSQEADRHRKAYSTYREESREMREEDMENFRRANRMQRDGRLIEGPEPEPGREYEESSLGPEPGRQYEDADRMAEHDALWGRLYEAGVGIHDAFGAEAEECLARLYDDPMDVLSDPSLSDDMRGAALEYVNAVNAYRGFVDAADDAVEAKRRQVEETVNRRTHRDSGMIVPATLKGGKDVYVVGGTVRMFDDGSGVDVAGSSRTVVVMDEGGQCRVVAPELFESVEAGIDPQTELQAAYDAIEREHNAMFGENAESLAEPEAQAQDQTAAQPEDNNGTENIPEEQEKESSLLSDHDVPEAQGFAENAESVPNSSVSVENVQETKAEGATTNYLREYTNKKSGKTIKIRPDISDPDKDGVVKVKFVGDVYDKEGNFIHQASFQHIIIAQEDIYKIEGLEGLDIYNEDGSFSATELRIAPSGEIGAYDREGVKIWLKRNPITGEEGKLPSFEKEISTALSRIPVDEETGEPVFEAVDKETAWDGLVEDSADEAEALQYAESMVKELEKDVKKAQEKLDNVPFSRNRPKFKAAKEKARKGLEEARKSLAHWQGMLDVHRSRQAQTRTPAEEISSDGKTIQPTETASPIDKPAADVPSSEEIELSRVPDWSRDTPQDARERGFRRNGPERIDRPEVIDDFALGKGVEVKFGDDAIPRGNVVLIEASQLHPSHRDGRRNPYHFLDEAQPKERTDAASRHAAGKIASRIRPEEITGSVTAYTGAPSVNSRGETIQGNNRSEALLQMYENHPEQAQKYKQYLIDHASEFGLTPESVAAMDRPVLVNMLDVNDEEAIRLGQYVAQDTESGGIERIKAKNVVNKMGDKIGAFARILLDDPDEELSLSQLIDRNGIDALKYLVERGYINDTQYGSAFDDDHNLKGEAANDLRGILYHSIFTGGSTRLEEMFGKLPAKAQRAILATAFRDTESERSARMIGEIQQSVIAFSELMGDAGFSGAKNLKDAINAVEMWGRQSAFDEVTGEPFLPSEKFSNFALRLAALYKGATQKFMQQTFNDLYDSIQGKEEDTLFEAGDKTPKSLAEAIRKVLGIEYKPINKERNGRNGSDAVGVSDKAGEEGGSRGDRDAGGGEREPGGEEPADSGRGAEADSGKRDDVARKATFLDAIRTLYEKGKKVATQIFNRSFFDVAETPQFMKPLGLTGDRFTIRYGVISRHFGKDAEHDLPQELWERLPNALLEPFVITKYYADKDRKHPKGFRLYTSLQLQNGSYVVVAAEVKNAGRNLEVNAINTVFGRGKLSEDQDEVIHISDKITPEQKSLLDGTNPHQYPTARESKIFDRKDNTLLSDKQENGAESSGNVDGSIASDGNGSASVEGNKPSSLGERISEAEKDVDSSTTEAQKDNIETLGRRIASGKSKSGKKYEIVVSSDETRDGVRKVKFETHGDNGGRVSVNGSLLLPVSFIESENRAFEVAQGSTNINIAGVIVDASGAVKVEMIDGSLIAVNDLPAEISEKLGIKVSGKHREEGLSDAEVVGYEAHVGGLLEQYVNNSWRKKDIIKHLRSETESLKEVYLSAGYSAEESGSKAEQLVEGIIEKLTPKRIGGFDVYVENERGSLRSGIDAEGNVWETEMRNDYGFIADAKGTDGDNIDVFLSSDIDGWNGRKVFVVDQYNPDDTFDEHKVMLGFNDRDDAYSAYLSNYEEGWENGRRLDCTEVNLEDFEKWIESSKRKIKPFAEYKGMKPAEDSTTSDKPATQSEGGGQSEGGVRKGYTITPTTYTNKSNKTSDVWRVEFDHELSKEQKAALNTFVKGPLVEGRKRTRGWYDRKNGGYMMRSEEAAQQLAGMLDNPEAVADAQPLSREDIEMATRSESSTSGKPAANSKSSLRSDHDGRFKVTDEMRAQEDELRKLLGIDDDEGSRDVYFRDPDDLSPEQKRRVYAVGVEYAFNFLDNGVISFPDFVKGIVDRLGQKVKPFIKSWYEGAKRVPGYGGEGYTGTSDVDRFDIENFDKPSPDVLRDAEMRVAEHKAKLAAEQAEKELIAERNDKRRKDDKQREADTEAIAGKAAAIAKQAEAYAKNAGTGRKGILRTIEKVDETLDEVNDQLALLGYYEADLDSPEHEVYGLRRSAEKKAVKDAVKLAKQLVDDLGIEVGKVSGKTTEQMHKGRGKSDSAVRANVAPAGGDVTIDLPYPDGRNLHINIGLSPTHERGVELNRGGGKWEGDNLEVDCIMFRFGDDHNHFLPEDVTYGKMLSEIQRAGRWGQPKKSSLGSDHDEEEAYHGTVTLKDGREAVVIAANHTETMGEPARLTDYIVGVKGEPGTIKISPEEIAHAGAPTAEDIPSHAKEEDSHNGYKRGDDVMWDRYGNGKWEKVRIEDFDEHGNPIFDSLGTDWLGEVGDWSRVKPADGIFGEAKRVATKAEEDKKKAAEAATGKKEVKPEQTVGGLFGGLFDEPISDEKKTDVQSRPGTSERERGHEPRPNEPLGESQRNEVKGTDGRGMAGRGGSDTVPDTGRGSGVSEQPKKQVEPLPEAERKNVRNNHAERGVDYAPKGEDARIKANIEAIELAKRLLDAGETATPEQMAILRKFSGWGGLGKAFSDNGYNPTSKRLRELLGEDGYNDAVMSRNSAYYTPAPVIEALWDVARVLGFNGGNVLEGSAGIGNILGLMPTDISDRSNIHAVEIDSTTGGILSLLYPDAKVDIQGFERTKVRNNSVDLAITNVPFVTGLHVKDDTGDKDLSKKFRNIHDFCIAKNIRKLREGGLGIFITSSGTMDNSKELRRWIINEGNADVIGAFRMHNKTFGGTGATSDIIVVRKRINGKPSPNAIDVADVTGVRVVDYDTGETRKVKGQEIPIIKPYSMTYNKYFAEHPENMAGEMLFNFERGETRFPTSRALFPSADKPQERMLSEWAARFADMKEEATSTSVEEEVTRINEKLGEGVKEGSMVLNSQGELCMARMGEAVPLGLNKNKVKGHTKAECFEDYTAVKKALSDVLEYQSTNEDNAGLEPLLKELNRAFDTFTKRYGNLHKNPAISFLRNDVDFSSIMALETYSERGDKKGNKVVKVGKTDIFSRRVIETEKEPQPTTIKDGILASLYKSGGIDIDYISDALGKSADEVKQEIVKSGFGYENPSTGAMEVSYQYLSGNVRAKLHIAQENNEDGRYDANIAALEKVIPMTIPAHLIEFALGSSWIEPKLYEDFVYDKTGIRVKLTNVGGTWFMKTPWSTFNEKNRAMAVTSKICDKTIMGHELIEAAITNRQITVSKQVKHYDGTSETISDKAATAECSTKIDEIRSEFKDWARERMHTDADMSARIEETYNEQFNNYVPMSIPDEFVPQHFGGQVTELHGKPFALRPHQGRAVVRGTTEPILLAHEVGTGKTYTLITTAMEMRRLGTARKPMIVVQNATVGQFVESAKEIYPNAKVLTIEEADRTAEGRKNFYAKIKYNDWDMIVVPQSVFERIPDSPEREMAYIQDIIEEKMKVLEAMREADDDGRSMIVRQAEKELEEKRDRLAELTEAIEGKKKKRDEKKEATTRQNAEVRAMEMLDREVDDVENFDDMGIDAILVDEAHEYKHLGFATAMQRGVKGVDSSFSKKSQGVYLKTQAVMERNHGRNVVFATGTPISNTAAEIWTFMRYLMPADQMKAYDIFYFDDFVRNFGNLAQMVEFKTNGKFAEVNRFAGYVNLPELVRIWSGVTDTVLTREAGGVSDKIPEMEGGKPNDIYLPQTRALRSVMKYVKAELERYDNMTGREKKENSHIPLTMYGIAKAAAVDARLVIADAEDDPNSKTNATVRETLRSLKESAKYKGTVAIFSDNYQNKRSGFNLYEEIRNKLIAEGVPAEQIVVIKSGMTVKKKLDIFDKVNAGEVRVILGSTFTLGTGVNIQERLHTLIHVDAPNRPMDYTQRNGRAMRQGNLHKDMGIPVRIIRFGVEDSLDVTAYQRLKTKGAIADSIMNGSKMMQNSMENRVLEEDEDTFGDMTAQLSGSEYAILKNQAEREVRNLTAKQKGHDIDQIYVHNQLPKVEGFIKGAQRRIEIETKNLEIIGKHFPDGTLKKITIGKLSFDSVKGMEDFFKEQNAKMNEAAETIREGADNWTSRLTIDIDGLPFEVTTTVTREVDQSGQGTLSFEPERKVTYSCEPLGIKDRTVKGNRLKNVMQEIAERIVPGIESRELLSRGQNQLAHYSEDYRQLQERNGREFPFKQQLAEAKERLAQYEELMKKELEEKEAKYAEMDKAVDAATDISLDEDGEDTPTSGDGNKYRLVEQKELLDFLDGQPLKKGYRYSQWANMGVLPPMTAKENGEWRAPMVFSQWEQSEEGMRKANGKADLVQGNGRTTGDVAYNPYFHIRTSPLNDQFTAAYDRPELLVVEGYYPESEETSGYRAEGAKDAVGLMDWHSGSVNGQLSEETKVQTMLSRYFKPGRIVPWSEVAELIMERVGDQKITFPINAVPPMLRAELAKRGAKFGDISGSVAAKDVAMLNDLRDRVNSGEWDAGLEKAREYLSAYESSAEAKEARVEQLSSKLNTPVRIIRSEEELRSLSSNRERRAKGWWNSRTDEVVVVLPNNVNVADVDNTVVHEVVGHKGLRAFIGEERFEEFLGAVYDHASESIRKRIDGMAQKIAKAEAQRLSRDRDFLEECRREGEAEIAPGSPLAVALGTAEADRRRRAGDYNHEATEEYMADLAGRVGDEGFSRMAEEELTLWGKIKAKVQEFLDRFLRGLKIAKRIVLSDKDLTYILFKTWKHARDGKSESKSTSKSSLRSDHNGGGIFAEAEDVVRSQGTRFCEGVRNPGWKEKVRALTDTKNSPEGKTIAPEDSLSHAEAPRYVPSLPKNSDAKIARISENLKLLEGKIPQQGLGKNQIIFEIAQSLELKGGSNQSNYSKVDIPGVGVTTIRVSNHSANPSNFGATENNVGIVIKTSNHNFREKEDVDYVEFMYYGDKVAGNADIQRRIVEGLRHYIETGDFGKIPEPDRLNTSGAYRAAIDGLGEKMRFRDPDMGLEETITKMKAEAMQANADNLQAKKDAMRAIGGNLNHLRQAMARQREYDITTAKSIKDLARVLMENGLLDDLGNAEVKALLKQATDAVGRRDISKQVGRVFEIMVNNHLRNTEVAFGKLISMRTSQADGRGIKVQGALDPDGEAILKVFNSWKNLPSETYDAEGNLLPGCILSRMHSAMDAMSDPYSRISERASLEYAGLQIAKEYSENISESKQSEKVLREEIKKAKEEKDAGRMTSAAFRQFEEATRAAIHQLKLDRIAAYEQLTEQLGGELLESVERAKAWREAEKERVNRIHHLANSDMQGRELRGDLEDTRLMKLRNSWLVSWLLEPMSTLDQMLKMMGSKNPNGEGYMQNHFMRGWIDSADKEQEMKEAVHKQMDEKAAEIFGKHRTWHNGGARKVDYTYSDLYDYADALPCATIKYYDGAEMREYEIGQGELLYLYAVEKMPMGQATNRRMGIDEAAMQDITDALDPKLREYADWVQEELLPQLGDEANEVHKRMFGASMDSIENYFPFVRDKDALKREVENGQTTQSNDRISVQTGAIKKRVASVAKWNMRKCNFMDILAKHVDEMCHWTAFAELNRDFGTLLSYNRLKQQVFRMNSVYGAGEKLWKRFEECCAIATDAYEPQRAKFDRFMVQGAKGVTMGKISLRPFTALKQTLSLPAFFGEINLKYLGADIATMGVPACKWAWKNMPNFRKRILSRTSGDYRLKENEYDGKIMKASSYGMLPNIGVDAWTIAVGSHGVYKTRKAKYLRWGMEESQAERRAVQDAELCYNKSQQSSEGPFMAPVQVDHTFYATSAMLFRNSSTSYTREAHTSARNLKRLISGEVNEDYVAKQILRTLHPEAEDAWTDAEWAKARKNAKREIRSAYVKNTVNLAMFGWILPWLWRIGGVAPFLLLSGEDDEKRKQWEDAARQSMFAPIEGLAYGDVITDGLNMLTGANEKSIYKLGRSNPMLSDIMQAAQKADKDMLAAANDVLNILGGMAFGVNPQTLTDWTAAIIDYNSDAQTQRECALLAARLLSCPPSQMDKLYFEEIGLSAAQASEMSPAEIAERYAEYKIHRNAPLTGWMYSPEKRDSVAEKYRKRVRDLAKERIKGKNDTEQTRGLLDRYDEFNEKRKGLEALRRRDPDAFADRIGAFYESYPLMEHRIVGTYKRDMKELTNLWLKARTAHEADSLARTMEQCRARMMEELNEEINR